MQTLLKRSLQRQRCFLEINPPQMVEADTNRRLSYVAIKFSVDLDRKQFYAYLQKSVSSSYIRMLNCKMVRGKPQGSISCDKQILTEIINRLHIQLRRS